MLSALELLVFDLYSEGHFDVLLQAVGAHLPPPKAASLKINHQVFPLPVVGFCILPKSPRFTLV